jgi:hypothetical protein
MKKEYTNYYRILGVEPGVGWAQLRKAYKSLVNTWHPDRFQQDPRQRHLAEKKTKEIIQSFQELSEYYKEFGVLPHVTKAMGTPVTDNFSSQSSPDIHSEQENQDTEVSTADLTQSQVHKGRRNKFNVRIMAATALAGIAYLVWQGMPRGLSDNESQLKSPVEQSVDKKISEDSGQGVPATGKYFTVGTPLGEVYGIQGVPTKTEQDVWHYGNSKVYFAKGRVLGWDEYPSNPLKAKITQGSEKTNTKLFDEGSSKDEVLAIQGRPDRDSGNVWEYGVSRVYFENDRVKGWDNSPFNPLKIRQ